MEHTDTSSALMPRYRCHKEVHALKIAGVLVDENGDAVLTFTDPLHKGIVVQASWVERHKPEVGGYYVVYKDGYTSYSPAEAFVLGYTLIDDLQPFDGHPAVAGLLEFFSFAHLPEHLRQVSAPVCDLARLMANHPGLGGAELTVGLRKLLEAKDCFVRARLAAKVPVNLN